MQTRILLERAAQAVMRAIPKAAVLILALISLQRAALQPADTIEQVRAFTRGVEFRYGEWMMDALWLKNADAAMGLPRYLSPDEQKELVYGALSLIGEINRLDAEINRVYADPDIPDAAAATSELRARRDSLRALEDRAGLAAEGVIQAQVAAVVKDFGLGFLGQPVPPVLYHITPLPYALIVSPRDKIEQVANISLLAGMTLEERVRIEDAVEENLDQSALVVGIGGVGVYPTMVMSTTDLNWLVETVAHEWTHNYLTLRPLGLNYDTTPQLRTMNETTANIAGIEIGQEVIRRYYPERMPPPVNPVEEQPSQPAPQIEAETPVFDFRKEMRVTRVQVDELLAQGKVEEAEAYMEARRKVFVENGYLIRKLNQAYFAFYGAYSDSASGSGASGQDPVGPAVEELRRRSPSLAAFLNRISWITSFERLQEIVSVPQ